MSISSDINQKDIDQNSDRRGFFSILEKVQESCHRTEDKWACPAT